MGEIVEAGSASIAPLPLNFGIGHGPLQDGVEDVGLADEAKRELECAQGRDGDRAVT